MAEERALCPVCGGRLYKEGGKCRGCVQRGISVPSRGHELSEEHIEKLKIANTGNKHRLGKLHRPESKAKMSLSQKGKPRPRRKGLVRHTEEWKRRCRAWMLGNKNGKGHVVTDADKERIRCIGIETRRKGKYETSLERKVKALLLGWQIEYEQEAQINGVRGLVDFYLPKHLTVVECDGEYYHRTTEQKESDLRRDNKLNILGVRVLRLPEKRINKDWEGCMSELFKFLTGGNLYGA